MSIFQGSRYEYSTVDFISTETNGDSYPVVFYEFSNLGFISYTEHAYVQGERLDELSYKYYQRSGYWWWILEYNPNISDPFNIEPGTVLRIPNV